VKKICTEEEIIPICELRENLNSVTTVQMLYPIENSIQVHSNQLKPTPLHEFNKLSDGYCIGKIHFDSEESAFKPFFQIKAEVAERL